MRFLQKVREESAGQVPAKDVMRRAAQLWKEAEEKTRAPFEAEYASARETYKDAMEEYKASGKHAAWRRDPAKPKRPLSGWLRYLEDFRKGPEAQDASAKEVLRRAATNWKGLPAAEKAPYEAAYTSEVPTYKRALETYKASGKDAEWKAKVGLTKPEAARAKAAAAKERAKAKELKMKERDKKRALLAKAKATAMKERMAKRKALEKAKEAKAKKAQSAKAAKEKEKLKAAALRAAKAQRAAALKEKKKLKAAALKASKALKPKAKVARM
jgi:hypothetical protein